MENFQRYKKYNNIYFPAFVSFCIIYFGINIFRSYNNVNSFIVGECTLQNCSYTRHKTYEIYCRCNVITPAEYSDITDIKFIYGTSNKDDLKKYLKTYENSNTVCYIPKKLNKPIKLRLKYIRLFWLSIIAMFINVFALISLFKHYLEFTRIKYIKIH